jgi:hypothetical protein
MRSATAPNPWGVAAYRVSPQLPKQLEGELPTPDELAREFPLMAVVKLRIDIERTLRRLAQQRGVSDGPSALGPTLQRLAAVGGLPPDAADFDETLRALDATAHGTDVSADAAAATLTQAGLLAALRRLVEDP